MTTYTYSFYFDDPTDSAVSPIPGFRDKPMPHSIQTRKEAIDFVDTQVDVYLAYDMPLDCLADFLFVMIQGSDGSYWQFPYPVD